MKQGRIKFLIILVIILPLSLQIIDANLLNNSSDLNNQGKLHTSSQITNKTQWLNNSDFDSSESWYKTLNTDELNPDVNGSIVNGKAKFEVLGIEDTFSIRANFSQPEEWEATLNPEFPIFPEWPDSMGEGGNDQYNIDSNGFWTRHQWTEGPRQTPSIQWVQLVKMPINMCDYVITSANVSATVRGWVDRNIDVNHPSDTPEGSQNHNPQGVVYDNVRFYVKIAKPDYNPSIDVPYEIAWNKTKYLGLYNFSEGLDERIMGNTHMNTIQESDLIRFLTSVLSKDYKNFTVILGMDIFCEDNCASEIDEWNSLRITSFSLNFTYRKKINQFAYVSWNQDGKKLNELINENYTIIATGANLKFKYKIDKDWTTATSSINSEINMYLNGNPYPIPIKLINVNSTDFEEANFELTPPIGSVNLSIQLLLKDTFNLNESITISIDNVTLDISYIIFVPDIKIGDGGGNGDSSKIIHESGLNWIILGILLVLIGILAIFFIQNYILIPRKREKQVDLISRTQKFRDMTNIQAIILIHKLSGLPIFTRRYSILEKKHDTLFSGFIQAIITISEEIQGTKFKEKESTKLSERFKSPEMDVKSALEKIIELDFKYFYCLIADRNYFRFVFILKDPASERLKSKVTDLLILLDNQYSEQMKKFDGDLTDLNINLPTILNNFFALYYKDLFRLNRNQSYLIKIRKERKLTRLENQIINAIKTNFKGKKQFRLKSILDLVKEEDKNLIIDAIEKLLKLQIITRYISDYK